MLAWCSITVRMISSPSSSMEPNEDATRFMASVVPRVKITSFDDAALIYSLTLSRLAS